MEISKIRLVVFDLETTNPPENYKKHEIIEIAGIEIIDQCQAISLKAQTAHFYLCLLTFLVLENFKKLTLL